MKERLFVNEPIADEKMGVISPRAFTRYDPDKEPEPKYVKEILENSLSQAGNTWILRGFPQAAQLQQEMPQG